MNFGKRLKELREKHGLRQEDLAKILNMTRQAIGNYEQGIRFPGNEDVLCAIADYFQVSLDYLMGRTDHPSLSYPLISGNELLFKESSPTDQMYNIIKSRKKIQKLIEKIQDLPDETIDKICQFVDLLVE